MNQKKELLTQELSTFDREQIVAGLEAAMVNAGYDDIRAEYNEQMEKVCFTKYGALWKPVDKRWISTNTETAVELFDKLYYSWIDMSTSTTLWDFDFQVKEIMDNLLSSMLESGYSDIRIGYSEGTLILSNKKGNTINIDLSTFSDTRELLKMAYLILRRLSGY